MSALPLAVRPEEWAIVRGILQRLAAGREVWAFGSRARGTPKPYSDLDLAILGDAPLPLDALAALREAFTESDLPYKVDVIDWAAVAPEFRRVIEAGHVALDLK
ncbi:MAG: nucleotidyltransferase domain-containing protein [Pseudomonadota bacterium]